MSAGVVGINLPASNIPAAALPGTNIAVWYHQGGQCWSCALGGPEGETTQDCLSGICDPNNRSDTSCITAAGYYDPQTDALPCACSMPDCSQGSFETCGPSGCIECCPAQVLTASCPIGEVPFCVTQNEQTTCTCFGLPNLPPPCVCVTGSEPCCPSTCSKVVKACDGVTDYAEHPTPCAKNEMIDSQTGCCKPCCCGVNRVAV